MDLVTNKTIDKLKYDLVRNNIITFEDLEKAQSLAAAQNINLGQVLINTSMISEADLLKFLEEKLHIPFVDLENYEIDKKCLNFISYSEAVNYKILPLFEIEDILTIAMADPLDLFAIDKIIEGTNKTIEPVLGSEKSILRKINEYYDAKGKVQDIETRTDPNFKWQDELHNIASFDINPEGGRLDATLNDEYLQNLFRAVLKHAIKEDVHELFFEHTTDGLSVNFKKTGESYSTGTIPTLLVERFIQMIKKLCTLDPTVSEVPQLGKLNFNVDSIALTASISAFPTINGERILLKIYHPPKKIDTLINDKEKIDTLKFILNTPGIILVSGGTLSGKTHLVYSILNDLVSKDRVAMTLESVAKYKLHRVLQSELNESVGFNMDKAMRFIEFQSPDIVYFEGISTKEGLDFLTSLALQNKTLITEFLADNMEDLRRKFDRSEFSLFKSLITCLVFIHNQNSIEIFDKSAIEKYLL